MKRFTILLATVLALFAIVGAASAQPDAQTCTATGSPVSTTYTEDQINSTFWVTNPVNRNVSNVYVDLMPGQVAGQLAGQVAINETYTYRTGGGTQTAAVIAVLAPFVSNGRVQWTVVSITADGQPASDAIIEQVNAALMTSWRRWIADQAPVGHFNDVTITENDITYTYVPWDRGCVVDALSEADIFVTAEPGSGVVAVTVTEAQINASFAVTNPVNRNLSDVYVDLQPGQVVITATYTARARGGQQSAVIAVVLTPTVSNGRVEWNVVSATANNQSVSAEIINQINAALNASWRRWIAGQAPTGRVSSVTISDSEITYHN